jgi:hypothetical protein
MLVSSAKPGARTCTLDTKNIQIILIALEGANQFGGGRKGGGNNAPAPLDILVVGR